MDSLVLDFIGNGLFPTAMSHNDTSYSEIEVDMRLRKIEMVI